MKSIKIFLMALAIPVLCPGSASVQAQLYNFITIAGNAGYGSADGIDSAARLNRPQGVGLDQRGNIYVADTANNTIRKLTSLGTNWVSSTIAGLPGSDGSADGLNDAVRFNAPRGIVVDSSDNVYIADSGNLTIRKLTPVGTNWVSSTIAGMAGSGGSADGTNSTVRFQNPFDVAVDGGGNVYVTDPGNNTIRKLTLAGTNWVSSTIAGPAGSPTSADGIDNAWSDGPYGLTVDHRGNVFVTGDSVIRQLTPAGTHWVSSTIAGLAASYGSDDGTNSTVRFGASFLGIYTYVPHGIAVDTNGIVYVADTFNFTLRKLTPVGTNWVSSTIAGLAGVDGHNDGTGGSVRFAYPYGVAVDRAGSLYVADSDNSTIRKLTPVGTNWTSSTIAGLGGSGGSDEGINSAARFRFPAGIAVDASGNLFVGDVDNNIVRKLTRKGADWVSSTIAGLAGNDGSADGTNSAARFSGPYGVAVDSGGSVYVADTYNNTIRKLTPVGTDWVSSTIAGLAGAQGSADGTDSTARFYYPSRIAVDRAGNVYVVDSNNHTLRKLTQAGTSWVSSTIAGRVGSPGSVDDTISAGGGIALDGRGNVYVALGNSIRKLTPVGTNWVSSTIAGLAGAQGSADGTNSAARFDSPFGVAVDSEGVVYVADTFNFTIRRLTPVGTNWVSSTIAGLAGAQGSADGTNSAVRLSSPIGIAVDDGGFVYVADSFNNTIRMGLPLISRPIIHTVIQVNGQLTITWSATPGQTYQVQHTSDLGATLWQTLGNPMTATNGAMSATDALELNRQRFYRVQLLP